ncbi:MAG: hypothetical protein ABR535_10025 [Pyrinomonadaceae bacterium]
MINESRILSVLSLTVVAAGFVLLSGDLFDISAQTRDPFAKPAWARTRDFRPGAPGSPGAKSAPVDFGPPNIEQRIEYYKRMRETAAVNGQTVPKVTSVLTLDEMAVTGIFRTPRGYAAMVEATPIKLSYTVYPGEKFFDGQLVAVEENRLVFRKVTKVRSGKFVTAVENKALRKYTDREVVQGTAPVSSEAQGVQPRAADIVPASPEASKKAAPVVSPLDEMNKQKSTDAAGDKAKKDVKTAKKPVKVARKQ